MTGQAKLKHAVFPFRRCASPKSSIGDEMFRPRSGANPGLGIQKLNFFSPRVFGGKIYQAIANTSYCGLKWMPLTR
jgi:hypothetical protein